VRVDGRACLRTGSCDSLARWLDEDLRDHGGGCSFGCLGLRTILPATGLFTKRRPPLSGLNALGLEVAKSACAFGGCPAAIWHLLPTVAPGIVPLEKQDVALRWVLRVRSTARSPPVQAGEATAGPLKPFDQDIARRCGCRRFAHAADVSAGPLKPFGQDVAPRCDGFRRFVQAAETTAGSLQPFDGIGCEEGSARHCRSLNSESFVVALGYLDDLQRKGSKYATAGRDCYKSRKRNWRLAS